MNLWEEDSTWVSAASVSNMNLACDSTLEDSVPEIALTSKASRKFSQLRA